MNKLNIRFDLPKIKPELAKLEARTLFTKSEVARAAMNIGLKQLSAAKSATLMIDENK